MKLITAASAPANFIGAHHVVGIGRLAARVGMGIAREPLAQRFGVALVAGNLQCPIIWCATATASRSSPRSAARACRSKIRRAGSGGANGQSTAASTTADRPICWVLTSKAGW